MRALCVALLFACVGRTHRVSQSPSYPIPLTAWTLGSECGREWAMPAVLCDGESAFDGCRWNCEAQQ